MARKNENSAAVRRDRPLSKPPMIVAPERLVPGISASAWNRPSFTASMRGQFVHGLHAFFVFAPLGPQDDDAADHQRDRHRHRVEQDTP